MKIGIITINDNTNYGNRLQNLATQTILQNLGHEVITIKNEPYDDTQFVTSGISKMATIENYIRVIPLVGEPVIRLKRKMGIAKRKFQNSVDDRYSYLNKRRDNFNKFTKKYIKESEFILNEYTKPDKRIKTFDYFLTGSDQVWNPLYKRANAIYFLQFAPKNKRLSISASFGISEYPKNKEKQLEKYLNGMEAISVREEDARKLVEKYSKQTGVVLVDPTLGVDSKLWFDIEKKPELFVNEKYVITFFIGNMSENQNKFVKEYAKARNCKIICLNDKKYDELMAISPDEYLYYIHHAECIFTDSFHACVFSIIFHRNFYAFDRVDNDGDMSSRLLDLTRKFSLEDRFFKGVNYVDRGEISQEKYLQIEEAITVEQNKMKNWLLEKLK